MGRWRLNEGDRAQIRVYGTASRAGRPVPTARKMPRAQRVWRTEAEEDLLRGRWAATMTHSRAACRAPLLCHICQATLAPPARPALISVVPRAAAVPAARRVRLRACSGMAPPCLHTWRVPGAGREAVSALLVRCAHLSSMDATISAVSAETNRDRHRRSLRCHRLSIAGSRTRSALASTRLALVA